MMGVDPGSSKCGIAVVEEQQTGHTRILYRGVVPTEDIAESVRAVDEEFAPEMIVVGDGTRSKPIQSAIRDALPGKSLLIVDERDTSIRARERYWIENKRPWWKIGPSTLYVPREPVDDYVAVILAERVLNTGD
ncbi:MAG: crossover junction endodeoxyribonuclease RuvC [Fimbriimonadales bacterium]